MLLDAIACVFYGIDPNSYRRKSRKFNQHDLLRQVFNSLNVKHQHEEMKIIVDSPEWTSFDALKKDILSSVSRKNSPKFQSIMAMFACDQYMAKIGLTNVIKKAFQVLAGYSKTDAPSIIRSTTSLTLQEGILKSFSCKRHALNCDMLSSLPIRIANELLPHAQTDFCGSFVGVSMESDFRQNHGYCTELPDMAVENVVSPLQASTVALFLAREGNHRSLSYLFGDGMVISIAAAAAENLGLMLRWKINEFEWCFESLDSATTIWLEAQQNIRVRGYNVHFYRHFEHL